MTPRFLRGAVLLLAGLLAAAVARPAPRAGADAALPATLADTGLYADFESGLLAPDVLAYEPQYPLWSDGAAKSRWIRLPPGTAIDASDPDDWAFPIGTRLWKEFRFGRRVETRYMERRADGTWSYAAYVWSEDGRAAPLAPDSGVRRAALVPGGPAHDIPSRIDCRACHTARAQAVLGFSALQLSPDRDPLAPHAVEPAPGSVDLRALVRRGLVRGLPDAFVERAPRIEAATPRARAALGYLHSNCGNCHAADSALSGLGLDLRARIARPAGTASVATALAAPMVARSVAVERRLEPGDPDCSGLVRRMSSRQALTQMPPLGSARADGEALALLRAWIREDLVPSDPVAPVSSPPTSPTRLNQELLR